jgi:putative hemolysin
MDSKTKVAAALIILIIAGGLLYYYFTQNPAQDVNEVVIPEEKNSNTGIANPASVNCKESNGTLVIRTDSEGGEYGVCVFSSGAECEEWSYYRGECIELTDAVLNKEFGLWVGNIAQLKLINLQLRVNNLSDNNSAVYVESVQAGKESELKINNNAEATFEGYSIRVASISLKEGAQGNKPNDYKIRLMVSKIEKPADNSCTIDSDCAVKDVGSLCGKYLGCVNKGYTPVPPEINSNICSSPEIDGCKCLDGRCIGSLGGKLDIN